MVVQNAGAIRRQTEEIGDLYNEPADIAMDKLVQAHHDLLAALDAASRLREEGIHTARRNIDGAQRAHPRADRQRARPRAGKTRGEPDGSASPSSAGSWSWPSSRPSLAARLAIDDAWDPVVIVHWANSHPMREGLLPEMAE